MSHLEYRPEQLRQRPGLLIILGDQFLNKCNMELNIPGLELGGDPDRISALTQAAHGFTSTFRSLLHPLLGEIRGENTLADARRYNKASSKLEGLVDKLQSIQKANFGSKGNTRDVTRKLEDVAHALHPVAESLLREGFLTQAEFASLTAIKPEESGLDAMRDFLR